MARVIEETAEAVMLWRDSVTGQPLLWLDANLKQLLLGTTVIARSLPTADPHVIGQVWANAGVLTLSAG